MLRHFWFLISFIFSASLASPIASADEVPCVDGYKQLAPKGLGRNPKIPDDFAASYPKVAERIQWIGERLEKRVADGYVSERAKKDVTDRIGWGEMSYNARDTEALRLVIDRIHNVTAWSEYAKNLTLASARWIDRKGSAAEKAKLLETGEISRRAMLAVLAQRAKDRGETFGKMIGTDSRRFNNLVMRGPFIDRGLDSIPAHGQLPHALQMDFIAPYLEYYYGKGSREFYQKILATGDWNPLFDRDHYHFSSPTGIRVFLGEVLPLANTP